MEFERLNIVLNSLSIRNLWSAMRVFRCRWDKFLSRRPRSIATGWKVCGANSFKSKRFQIQTVSNSFNNSVANRLRAWKFVANLQNPRLYSCQPLIPSTLPVENICSMSIAHPDNDRLSFTETVQVEPFNTDLKHPGQKEVRKRRKRLCLRR